MADVKQLFQAAIQAVDAGAHDLAADFAERAVRELRGDGSNIGTVPWSTDPRDDRFHEFAQRGVGFLTEFLNAGSEGLTEEQAKLVTRRFFAEQPRVVGPTFYRSGSLDSTTADGDKRVRITKSGRGHLKQLEDWLESWRRHSGAH